MAEVEERGGEERVGPVRPAAEAKGIRVSALLDPAADTMYGDAERLQQVVWNLLSNAVKFAPNGGRVEVRLERADSHVKIVVADSDKSLFLAAGARGSAAIYTEHLALLHIIRKVLLRVSSYLDYVIIKHSISLGH